MFQAQRVNLLHTFCFIGSEDKPATVSVDNVDLAIAIDRAAAPHCSNLGLTNKSPRLQIVDVEDPAVVDTALAADAARRELSVKVDTLRAERKSISAEVGALLAAGAATSDARVIDRKAASQRVADQLSQLEGDLAAAETSLEEALLRIPNPPDDDIPVGGAEANRSIRTWVPKGSPSADHRKVWDQVARGQQVTFAAAKLGATAGSVDDAVRRYYTSLGYVPDYKLPGLSHRTGHGIGMDGHEPVNLVRGETTRLAPGMCFSNEPGLYLPGKFGVRLEDCFHMTSDGPRWFSTPPRSIDRPFG